MHEPAHRVTGLPLGSLVRHKVSAETSSARAWFVLTQRRIGVSADSGRARRASAPARRRSPRIDRARPRDARSAARRRSLRDREPRVRRRAPPRPAHPLDQLLEPRARRHRLAALEVDQLAGQPVADRPPHVLLEQAVRQVGQRLALVERAREPRGERVAERRERARLAEVGLRVADPDLDRREGEVRAARSTRSACAR